MASADLALEELTSLGVSEKRAVRVHDLVIALRRHAPTSGDVVKVAPVDAMGGYAGARRLSS